MKNYHFPVLFGLMLLLLLSCNLSEFELNRFAKITQLSPVIYRPFSSGTYLIKDYATVPGIGAVPYAKDSLNLNPIIYQLNGITFNTTGSDSMVVIIKTKNETPMKYRYTLSFVGTTLDSQGKVIKKYLDPATINVQGDVVAASTDSLEYKLNSKDVSNLGKAVQIDLLITFYQPATGNVLSNVLRGSQISFWIGFRAPVNLLKIKL